MLPGEYWRNRRAVGTVRFLQATWFRASFLLRPAKWIVRGLSQRLKKWVAILLAAYGEREKDNCKHNDDEEHHDESDGPAWQRIVVVARL